MKYDKIENEIKKFVDERDWDKFHSPKNLSMALSVEASELVEIFQWQKEEEINDLILDKTKDEVADIFYYLVRVCQKMNIDLEEVFFQKMKKNRIKYPAEEVRGKFELK